MTALQIYLYIGAALLAFGALCTVALVGKPREPVTSATAVGAVILTALVDVVMIAAALKL